MLTAESNINPSSKAERWSLNADS